MRVADLNWMQLEAYLEGDDRIVLPLGSTEQHAYLSLATDSILAERVALEAAEPLGVPVLPALAYGITPYFAAYPGSPSLREETYLALLRDLIDSLRGQGFRRILLLNGHGGNAPAESLAGGGVLFQELVERAAGHGADRGPRSRHEPRLVDGELPLDAAARRRAARRSASRWWPAPRRIPPRSARSSVTAASAGSTSGPTRR